jgi:hypothetical protein
VDTPPPTIGACMERAYQPNSPGVASEIIDGEAVIMNLKTGKYFSAASSGCLIWACIEKAQPVDHIAKLFVAQYAATPEQAKTEVHRFIQDLLAEDLIRAAESASPLSLSDIGGSETRKSFNAPILNTYSDMQDLLLLDPIHDVDEAGWPTPSASMKA